MHQIFLGRAVNAAQVRAIDPQFFELRIAALLKDGGLAEMETIFGGELYFVSAYSELQPTEVPLKENGENIRVTEENKEEYVRLLSEHFLTGAMRSQLKCIVRGFQRSFRRRHSRLLARMPENWMLGTWRC